MKTMTAYASILAAGMALAPMAASAATIEFWAEPITDEDPDINAGGGSGSLFIISTYGRGTPRNAGQSRACIPACLLNYQTGELLSSSTDYVFYDEDQWPPGHVIDEWKWNGGELLRIIDPGTTDAADTTLLTGVFAESVTATLQRYIHTSHGNYKMAGILTTVVIDDDLAAYYGVLNRGTGQFDMEYSGRLTPWIDAHFSGTVTFFPVPVPAALPLMLTALAGLGLIRLRRTQTA